jgi:hypothetical protein
MKPMLIILATFALCVATLFAPHHRQRENSFLARTLAAIYHDVFGSLDDFTSARTGTFLSFVLAALFASIYPAMLMVMIVLLRPAGGADGAAASAAGGAETRVIFVLGGGLALAGTAANFVGMLASHLTLGFGVSSASEDQTPFIVIIPIFQGLFALASVAIGFSATCAGLAERWVTS